MGKKFAPRVSKKNRKTITLADKYDIFRASDDKLLRGAKLDEIVLADIKVKDQVRTKFNDSSIKELAENIRANGLIQPLVLHRDGRKYTLICGERRYRAMSSIKMKKAPCFVLENKTKEELMAIQFSENSSREELHYIDKANGILNYQKTTKASERKIVQALGISKTEVHRSLLLAKLPKKIKEAAKKFSIEKYVLLEFFALNKSALKTKLEREICQGKIVKRAELRRALKNGGIVVNKGRGKAALPKGMTANAFVKALKSQTKNMEIDAKTRRLLNSLVEDTKDLVND
jgi:ParB family chromosome partitioning protein